VEPWREGGSAVRGTNPDPHEETRERMRVKMVGAGPAGALMLMASVLLVMMAMPAAASTTGVERMENAGWTCIDFGPLGIHCFNAPSTALFQGEGPTTVQARVFMVDQDGHEAYDGTELLIRADVFERNPNGDRPCPQEGGHWHDLRDDFGLPYYGCHHYDTSS
jgi:hypothetical protein